MKLFIFYLFLLICFISCKKSTEPDSTNGWRILYTNQDGNSYRSIHFTDEKNGWIVGDDGTIKNTSDGGQSWEKQMSNVQANLWDVCFITDQIGWVCGDSNTILYTMDGGNSWEKSLSFDTNRNIFLSISFVNRDIGWMCNNNGEIFKSNNGGENWFLVKRLRMRHGSRLMILDSETVYILQGDLCKTYDGGSTWDSVDISYPENYMSSDIFFIDEDNGWITTMNGTGGMIITNFPVILTNNGGDSWQNSQYIEDMGLTCCYFINNKLGWIAGFNNVYKTENGGINWKLDFSPEHLGANEMFFLNENHGWILTWKGDIYNYCTY